MGNVAELGAVLFGVVIGWVTYRTLVRRSDGAKLSDIATVIGAVGGGAVVALFNNAHMFGLYSVGLAVGFFAYLGIFAFVNGRKTTASVMADGEDSVKIR